MKILATLLTSATLLLCLPTQAHALRVRADVATLDQCPGMPGLQSLWDWNQTFRAVPADNRRGFRCKPL